MSPEIKVVAYSGYKANERPLYFFLDGEKVNIREIIKQWRDREYDYFSIVGTNNKRYLLKWERYKDQWSAEQKANSKL